MIFRSPDDEDPLVERIVEIEAERKVSELDLAHQMEDLKRTFESTEAEYLLMKETSESN